MKSLSYLLTMLLLTTGCSLYAQEGKKKSEFTLERLVQGQLVQTEYAPSINWLKDGERYSRIEQSADGGTEITAYHAKDNKREVLIPSTMLRNPENGKALYVRSLAWNKDNSCALIYTNTKKVWRYDTRGDYWVLSLKSGRLSQLGKTFPESSLMFAKFSPDGKKVAYVSSNNIYAEDVETGTIQPITTDGNKRIINGTFDWVYEEEFGCRDGFRWSPDSKYIAYWQSDTDGTGVFDIINNIDSLYPKIIRFPYPKAGTTNSAVKVGYVSANGGTTTWISIPGDPRENYIPRLDFIPGANELFIQQMNRAQNTNRVWTIAIGKTEPTNIFTETDAAWLDTNDNITWLEDNKYFTWESERSGWRHVYRISRDGSQIAPITRGEFDCISIEGIDTQKGLLYFIASPENFTQRYLYQTSLSGKETAKRVSPAEQAGQHSYYVSPTGRWAVHTYSNAYTPPVIDMVSFPAHKSVHLFTDNSKAKEQYNALALNRKEFLKVKSGELMLDAWMLKPVDFDPAKKYPVIIEVYGEPWGATVQDAWKEGDLLWQQYLASQGYIVVSIENRGARSPRGREWRKCIYGEVGTFSCEDQAQGITDMTSRYPFLDAARIGIFGSSGGGSQTLNCMFRYPKVFRTGIAIAAVADQRLYNTIYQERYMNTPQNNPEGYRKGSPISWAEGLEGNLLIIHGTGDDNVHYQNCEMLVNELVKYGKIFSQLSYPMRSHGINERKGTTLHMRKSMMDFWKKNL